MKKLALAVVVALAVAGCERTKKAPPPPGFWSEVDFAPSAARAFCADASNDPEPVAAGVANVKDEDIQTEQWSGWIRWVGPMKVNGSETEEHCYVSAWPENALKVAEYREKLQLPACARLLKTGITQTCIIEPPSEFAMWVATFDGDRLTDIVFSDRDAQGDPFLDHLGLKTRPQVGFVTELDYHPLPRVEFGPDGFSFHDRPAPLRLDTIPELEVDPPSWVHAYEGEDDGNRARARLGEWRKNEDIDEVYIDADVGVRWSEMESVLVEISEEHYPVHLVADAPQSDFAAYGVVTLHYSKETNAMLSLGTETIKLSLGQASEPVVVDFDGEKPGELDWSTIRDALAGADQDVKLRIVPEAETKWAVVFEAARELTSGPKEGRSWTVSF